MKSAEVASLAYGLSSEEIVADTITMMNNVQMFGFRTPDEFARISKAARDAHASVSELAGVMGKFDTFETAASAVGDLNATLGTNFDALELMTLKYTDQSRCCSAWVKASVRQECHLMTCSWHLRSYRS